MLEMRPDCESCGKDLPADQEGAFICSFECSFCTACNDRLHHNICPNCGGELQRRAKRTGQALNKYPAGMQRKFNDVNLTA